MNPVFALFLYICAFLVSVNCLRFHFKYAYEDPGYKITFFDVIVVCIAGVTACGSVMLILSILWIVFSQLPSVQFPLIGV